MDLFLQLIVTGIVTGSLYAILGLSFGLIYGVTRIFHFAHVIAYAFAGYITFAFVRHLGWPLWASFFPGAAAAVAIGLISELAVYRPMRHRDGTLKTIMIASLGLFFIGQNSLQLLFGPSALTYYPSGQLTPTIWGPIVFNARDVWTVVIALTVFTGTHFVLKTKAGRALRAVVDSSRMAAVVGIDVKRAYLLAFVLGSIMVVPAAMLTVSAEGATPWMGLNVIFPAVAATVVGGVGSLRGAALAGFLIGLMQNVLVFRIGNQWQNAVIFGVLVLFFLYRPQGFFGKPVARVRV